MSNYLGISLFFWVSPKDLGHISGSVLCEHTACLLRSIWIHSTNAAVIWHQHLEKKNICCNQPAYLPTAFPGLSSATPGTSHIDAPHLCSVTPSCLHNQYHVSGSYLTTFTFNCQHNVHTWLNLEHSFCVLTMIKYFLEDFNPVMLVSS